MSSRLASVDYCTSASPTVASATIAQSLAGASHSLAQAMLQMQGVLEPRSRPSRGSRCSRQSRSHSRHRRRRHHHNPSSPTLFQPPPVPSCMPLGPGMCTRGPPPPPARAPQYLPGAMVNHERPPWSFAFSPLAPPMCPIMADALGLPGGHPVPMGPMGSVPFGGGGPCPLAAQTPACPAAMPGGVCPLAAGYPVALNGGLLAGRLSHSQSKPNFTQRICPLAVQQANYSTVVCPAKSWGNLGAAHLPRAAPRPCSATSPSPRCLSVPRRARSGASRSASCPPPPACLRALPCPAPPARAKSCAKMSAPPPQPPPNCLSSQPKVPAAPRAVGKSRSWTTCRFAPGASCAAGGRTTLGRRLLKAVTVAGGRAQQVRRLLAAGADPNFTYGNEWTPLHQAARKGNSEVLALLLRAGAGVSARTLYGLTALHMAACSDYSGRSVQLLLEAGADMAARNRSGRTALHYAAECGNAAAVRALLAAGACSFAKNNVGETPFDAARTECVRRLLMF